jgi:hypothetical protein
MMSADLTDADLRGACLVGACLDSATLTGARVHGVIGTGQPIGEMRADWVDCSANASGAERVAGVTAVTSLLSGRAPQKAPTGQRFFGQGDVLRNASLEFGSGASVLIESLFEQCTVVVGEGTELVIGKAGTLSRCQIAGPAKLTIHGKFVERESPGIAGVKELIVTSSGSLVGGVEQPPEHTRFAFEPGCMLRTRIRHANGQQASKGGRHR